ncbi:MAG: sulfite exporter TauE/SafE family protein [Bradymonadia bacterium]
MLIIAGLLSALMGTVLGLLGGGGSIMAVPILVYVVGVGPKEAIATSLLVVGATSLAAMAQHARAGNVRWRTGLIFGVVAMLGAYLGGLVAGYIPGAVLLLLFAALMVATGFAMLRKARKKASNGAVEAEVEKEGELPVMKVALEGLVVGAVTGLVGAGGGFLVVPALVLLGGLPMKIAVGTSLLVISMKSFAGALGHLDHVTIDMTLTLVFTAAAVAGSFGGAALGRRLNAATLRTAFAWFVLLMAAFILYKEMTVEMARQMFVDHWYAWVIGTVVVSGLLFAFKRRKSVDPRAIRTLERHASTVRPPAQEGEAA